MKPINNCETEFSSFLISWSFGNMLLDGWFENQFASLRVLIASPARIFMQRKYLKPVLRISTASSLDLGQHQIWALHALLRQSLTRFFKTGGKYRPAFSTFNCTWLAAHLGAMESSQSCRLEVWPSIHRSEQKCSVWTCGICNFKIVPKKSQVVTCNQQGLASLGLGLPLPISRWHVPTMRKPHAHCTLWVSRGHRFCQKPWFAWLLFHEFWTKSHTIFAHPFQSLWLTSNLVGFEGWLRAWDFVVFQELLELTPPQLHSILERDLRRIPKVSMIIEIQPEVWWLSGELFYTEVRWRNPMDWNVFPKIFQMAIYGQKRPLWYILYIPVYLIGFFPRWNT